MRFAIIIVLGIFFASCKDDSNPVSKIEDIVFPESNISYYRTIQPLFNIACATSGCHDIQTKASNLDLSDYTGIKQRFYDVVIPGDTSLSRLIWSIEARAGSAAMPPFRSLTFNQIRGFKIWIMEGATDTIR
ncbi:MAG: c-type cytochrome domain-containing protein [Bacteroidota bacterium]